MCVTEDENDMRFNYNKEALLIRQWGGCLLQSQRERERETARDRLRAREKPSVSPTLWPTERALRESAPGRHPGRDRTLPDIQTHLQSTVAVARSEPDPHFNFALCTPSYNCLFCLFPFFFLLLPPLLFYFVLFFSCFASLMHSQCYFNLRFFFYSLS